MSPCIAACAPACWRRANSCFIASWAAGRAGVLATAKSAENRRSLPMISGTPRAKLPSSGVWLSRVNSGIAMPSFFDPPWVTLRKTSTP